MLEDRQLKRFFQQVDMERLKSRQRDFFTQALGGPARYRGPTMKRGHAHLAIEKRHFERVAGHLVDTLTALGVSRSLTDEVAGAVAPLADDIINTTTTASQSRRGRSNRTTRNSTKERETNMQRNRSRAGGTMLADPPVESFEGTEVTGALDHQRTNEMVENMPTAVIVTNTDLIVTYMNPASLKALTQLEEYLPCKAEEIVGKSIDMFRSL